MRRHAPTRRAAWVLGLSFALVVLALVPANAAPPTAATCSATRQLQFDPIPDQATVPGTTTVVVRAAKSSGSTDTNCTDTISLSIANDPGVDTATLSCAPAPCSTPAVRGVATFTASLSEAGSGYTLEACSPATNGVCPPASAGPHFFSGLFAVYNASTACRNNQTCSVTATAPGTQVSSQVSVPGSINKFIRAGLWGVPQAGPTNVSDLQNLDCAGYDEIAETATTFDYTGIDGKIVVNTISANVMKEIANQGVAHLEWCGASSVPFDDKFGNHAPFDSTLGMFVGLWPDCPTGTGDPMPFAPCVFARNGGGGGTGQISAVAPPFDQGGARH